MSDNGVNQLPPSIQGDGRKFISLLKSYLKDIASELDAQVKKVESIFNVLADNPDTIPEQIKSVTVEEKAVNGSVSLLIKWDSSDIKQYNGASIDVKVGDFHDTLELFESKDIVKHYDTTKTNQFTLDNVDIGKKYWIRVRGKDVRNAMSESNKSPVVIHYIAETKYVPRPPYEATVVFDKRGAYWSWKQYPQNDYEWTELRLDDHVGELHNRLELTTDLSSTAMPYARQGTGYLYNKGIGNSYSAPVKIPYSKSVPHAPEHLMVTPVFEGLYIEFDVIPDDCYGANIYINNEKHFVQDNKYSFNCSTGNYTIKVCFIDVFGEGELSTSKTISTIEELPVEMINKEKLGLTTINNAITNINKAREEVDSKIKGLNTSLTAIPGIIDAKVKSSEGRTESRITATETAINSTITNNVNNLKTSITQVDNGIELKVNAGINKLTGKEIVSRINLTQDTVAINGKYIHITGQTVIDNGIIVSKHIGDKAVVGTKIADGAITTDKLVANAITGDKIAGNAVTSDKIKAGSVTAAQIATDAVTTDKIKSNSITADKVVANAITGEKIAGNTISGDKIQADAIDASKIKSGSIDASKINVDRLDTITANVGDLNGGSITGGTFKNANGSFKIDPEGNIIGANIISSKISTDSIYQSGFHIQNIDFKVYKVKHGEWCPIPDGFTEEQCVFIPIGFTQTELYGIEQNSSRTFKIENNKQISISRNELNIQKQRFRGSCDLYFVKDLNSATSVGIKGKRQAIVESRSSTVYRSGSDNGYDREYITYSYGELSILVIAKK